MAHPLVAPNSEFPVHLPRIIQGGMGVGVSNWRLARAVSRLGQLGVVSGTAVDTLLVRRLQDGDPAGDVRRAMANYPDAEASQAVLRRYFLPEGRRGAPYKLLPMYKHRPSVARQQVTILAAFVEVFLAKEGRSGPVGVNLLTKVQLPNLAALYGAMIAGVDFVLMGAGIPRDIPGVLDALAMHRSATMRFDLEGLDPGETSWLTLDPLAHVSADIASMPLVRPRFLAIVSANSLATTLARKANGRVDGFVVETPIAGGHNAPPRGTMQLDAGGEPVYGDRDLVDLAKLRELGLPFWLAGGMASPESLTHALEMGAAGIQVGTLFAFCEESGIAPALLANALAEIAAGTAQVITDPRASSTGYPFKRLELANTPQQNDSRRRICDLGYLRAAFRRPDGRIDYRCPAEPVEQYVAKGGDIADTVGRRCLCNGLIANVGYAQERDGEPQELPLLTSGKDLEAVRSMLRGRTSYSAADATAYLLANQSATAG
jgi:nitronate monooxygenase